MLVSIDPQLFAVISSSGKDMFQEMAAACLMSF
jgi:hypothetical protein